MQDYHLDIQVEEPFGNLFRKEHALIAVIDRENKILVGLKEGFLPTGIPRLIGGGISSGEDSKQGALREINEELSITPNEKNLNEIFRVYLNAKDKNGNEYSTTTFVYLYRIDDSELYTPGDDVTDILKLTLIELKNLSDTYKNFPEDFWYIGYEGKHRWADYGKLYAPIHMWVYEYIEKNII